MDRKIPAEHGVVCSMPDQTFGYFGWPTVCRLDDGTLVVVASGLRNEHVCPFGRTILCTSRDNGATWTSPRVINDSPLDDRDAGVVCLGGRRLLVTWFTSDNRRHLSETWRPAPMLDLWLTGVRGVTDENVSRFAGAWVRLSPDGGDSWEPPMRVPINSPHGPLRSAGGKLIYLGKVWRTREDMHRGAIVAMSSADEGRTWDLLGTVPLCTGLSYTNCHEAHAVELPGGRLVGAIRVEHTPEASLEGSGILGFSVLTTISDDGGRTWSPMHPLGFSGSPPHLVRHSSGVLVMTYGYRQEPCGERVALSRDDGATWEPDYILRDDGPNGDLGYPATVELPGGELFSVYYQKPARPEDKCALLCSRWRLP